jgi:hypothetical protein
LRHRKQWLLHDSSCGPLENGEYRPERATAQAICLYLLFPPHADGLD